MPDYFSPSYSSKRLMDDEPRFGNSKYLLPAAEASRRASNIDIVNGDHHKSGSLDNRRIAEPVEARLICRSHGPSIRYDPVTCTLDGEGTSEELDGYFHAPLRRDLGGVRSIILRAVPAGVHRALKDTPMVSAPGLKVLDLSNYFLHVECKLLRTLKVDLRGCPSPVHDPSRDQYIHSLLKDSKDTLRKITLFSCADPHRWSSFVGARECGIRLPQLKVFDVDDDMKEAYRLYLKHTLDGYTRQ